MWRGPCWAEGAVAIPLALKGMMTAAGTFADRRLVGLTPKIGHCDLLRKAGGLSVASHTSDVAYSMGEAALKSS